MKKNVDPTVGVFCSYMLLSPSFKLESYVIILEAKLEVEEPNVTVE